jgi:formylmethanofuran dehydrogenase subunit C
MKGGTIVLMGGAELRTGAWMVRGTIVTLAPIQLLPTFSSACVYCPAFLRLYAKYLQAFGFHLPVDPMQGSYQRYSGDTSVPGKGEILVWQAAVT